MCREMRNTLMMLVHVKSLLKLKKMSADSSWLFIILTDLNDKSLLGVACIQGTVREVKGEIY